MEAFDISGKTIHLPQNADEELFAQFTAAYIPVATPGVTADGKEESTIVIGRAEKADYGAAEYSVNVTRDGVYIAGRNYAAAVRGFFSFLERLSPTDDGLRYLAVCGVYYGKPRIKFRCLHLCLFPETDLSYIIKRVRTAALTLYTHVIIEFWGTLRFDCMPELAWKNAFTKQQLRSVIREAGALGLEVIPMFNHLGHASGTSEHTGKHVVLDQNPRYGYMFSDGGWEWRTELAEVRRLLAEVRRELIQLCGKGSYFHIGCDEAYTVGGDKARAQQCAAYLNSVQAELRNEGRRAIMWGDMLLGREQHTVAPPEHYFANATGEVADTFLQALDREIVIADWQYNVKNRIWSTTRTLVDAGFDVVCCPWFDCDNIRSAVNTALETGAFGVMSTTWNSEGAGYCGEVLTGELTYGGERADGILRHRAAALTRRALPANGDYLTAGFVQKFPVKIK